MSEAANLDRGRGALLGLAVGDALGGPLEFLTPAEIADRHDGPVREMIGGGWLGLAPGQGTDDTAMALALARSMATPLGFGPDRALQAYLEWFATQPADVGETTRFALAAVQAGRSVSEASHEFHRQTGRSAGNGSLMRAAPIALRYLCEPLERTAAARLDSHLTHYDERAAEACVWFCDVLAVLIGGAHVRELSLPSRALMRSSSRDAAARLAVSVAGYVGTTLTVAAVAARSAMSFEEGLVWAVNLGGDADTNGAVAGALLGARFGARAIPERWLETLEARSEAVALADRMIELASRPRGRRKAPADSAQGLAIATPADELRAALLPFAGRLERDPAAIAEAEAAIAATGAFRAGPLLVSHVPERDMLYVLERDYCEDGLEPERTVQIGEQVSLILDVDARDCVGFVLRNLSTFDFEARSVRTIWGGPRFDVPAFDIEQGTVGLVAATARIVLGGLRTPDRVLFDAAIDADDPSVALELWEACLAEGNELARYALGYTLLRLGRAREAHEQLRHYSALVRRNAWAWCYLGQACEQLDDLEGAEYAYRRAVEATAAGSFETDAPERLSELLVRLETARRGQR